MLLLKKFACDVKILQVPGGDDALTKEQHYLIGAGPDQHVTKV
jgi:hypothetical protein